MIAKRTLELYKQGLKRDDFQLYHFEQIVKDSAFNEGLKAFIINRILGALKNSQLIKKSLIDHYVPFLPLEEEHLKECISDYVKEAGLLRLNKDQINCVLSYIPVSGRVIKGVYRLVRRRFVFEKRLQASGRKG